MPKRVPQKKTRWPKFSVKNNRVNMDLDGKVFSFQSEAELMDFMGDLSSRYKQEAQMASAEVESLKNLLAHLKISIQKLNPPPEVILKQIEQLEYHIHYTESYMGRAQLFASTFTASSFNLMLSFAGELLAKPKMLAGFQRDRYLVDEMRDYAKKVKPVTQGGLHYYHTLIVEEILKNKMRLGQEIGREELKEVSKNIFATKDANHLRQAYQVLSLLADYGVKGQNALEMLRGGHFIIEGDKGALFEKLKALEGAEQRFSSHFKETRLEEYGINCGRIIPEILFLTTFDPKDPDKKPANSHFQMESSPWRPEMGKIAKNPQNLEHIPHSAAYFVQKVVAERKGEQVKNLGPYGWSPNNDANPIRIKSDTLEAKTTRRPRNLGR